MRSHIKLLNEAVVEQLMQLLYSLHNASSANVHHTACAGLRQLAEHLADQAAAAAPRAASQDLEAIRRALSGAEGAREPGFYDGFWAISAASEP